MWLTRGVINWCRNIKIILLHFVKYLLSKNEERKYSIKDFTINDENLSYKHLCANTHPNFFLIDNNLLEKDIKIEQIRKILSYPYSLFKNTFSFIS